MTDCSCHLAGLTRNLNGRPFTKEGIVADEFELHDGTEGRFQESQFIAWYDASAGIGGAHRVAHEVPTGLANEQSGLITSAGLRWRNLRDAIPIDGSRSALLFGAETTSLHRESGLILRIDDPVSDVTASLTLEDFYDPIPVWNATPSHDQVMASIAPNHREASGRIHGSINIRDSHFDVDGLFHRDHSWGIRDWSTIISHRWVAGTFGPTLSFSGVVLQGPGNNYVKGGAIIRDGELTIADDIDIVVFQEADGISHRGGIATWHLASGEEFRVECTAVDGILIEKETFVASETLCSVRRDGSEDVGFCDFEVSNGLGIARTGLTNSLRAVASNGISRRG
jgi:hypothetical protein